MALGLPAAVLAVSVIAARPPQQAPVPDIDRSDARCFVAIAAIGQVADAPLASASMAGSLYFLGRLDGRLSPAQIENLLTAEASTLRDEDIPELARTCGHVLQLRGEQLQALGARLEPQAPPQP